MSGRISFIGAGPGAADLITVRGAKRIAEADIVVWAASLVAPECIQEHARQDAELVDSSRLTHEEAVEIYRRAERDKLKVARVHSGDPSLWGAVQEQHDACARMDLEVEIVPGVPAFSAAAAAIGRELTVPEVAQSVVLTRLEGGKTPMPDGEKVREFARHGTTMALFLSAARTGQLVEELRAGGYADDTPVLVAYKVTWPDELLLQTTLGELEKTVKQHKLWRHTLFLVGRGLTEGGTRSRLYHAGHFHTYRKADPAARRALRAQTGASRRRRSEDAEAGAASPATDALPQQRTDQLASDVAWWAVRDWQETARGVTRVATARGSARRSENSDDSQADLFASDAEAPEHSVVTADSADTAAASTADAQPESLNVQEPVAEGDVQPEVVVQEDAGTQEKAGALPQPEAPEAEVSAQPAATTSAAKTPAPVQATAKAPQRSPKSRTKTKAAPKNSKSPKSAKRKPGGQPEGA